MVAPDSLEEEHAFLDFAKAGDWPNVLRQLHEKPALINCRGGDTMRCSALHQAAFLGSTSAVHALLGLKADPLAKTAERDALQTPTDVAGT